MIKGYVQAIVVLSVASALLGGVVDPAGSYLSGVAGGLWLAALGRYSMGED